VERTTGPFRHLAVAALVAALLGACSGGGSDAPDNGADASSPTSSEPDQQSSAAEATTTTTEPDDLDEVAFPAIPGFQYALLPQEAIDFFAAGLSAEPGNPLVEAVDARVVQRENGSVGVLVAYQFGEQLDEASARDAFVAGVGLRAGVAPQAIEVGSRSMFRIVDSTTDTVGILWWEDDGLAFLALAPAEADAEEIAAARVAVQ